MSDLRMEARVRLQAETVVEAMVRHVMPVHAAALSSGAAGAETLSAMGLVTEWYVRRMVLALSRPGQEAELLSSLVAAITQDLSATDWGDLRAVLDAAPRVDAVPGGGRHSC